MTSAAATRRLSGLLILLLLSCPAQAHHEALFGPQSSRERTRETTGVVSAGMRVSKKHPITLSVTAPYSWIHEAGGQRHGGEDVLVGLRYRHDLEMLQDRWNREGNASAPV